MFGLTALMALVSMGCRVSKEDIRLKVLPHLVDDQGRIALEPGLLERDSYQAELRAAPEMVDRLRFDVKWTRDGRAIAPDTIRGEAVGTQGGQTTFLELESHVARRKGTSGWIVIESTPEQLDAFGKTLAWRALAYEGARLVGEARSFLWPGDRSLDSLEIQTLEKD